MNINSKTLIAGFPILKLRKFFQKMNRASPFDAQALALALNASPKDIAFLLNELTKQGFTIRLPKSSKQNGPLWQVSIKGKALGLSSAAKPLKRSTAEKKLAEFLGRIEMVRKDRYFLYKVSRVFIFGSYLSTKERLSDIDLAIELVPKDFLKKDFEKLLHQRIEEAFSKGRKFSNLLSQLSWPQTEVWNFLKSRSRTLSIHHHIEGSTEIKMKLLYQDPSELKL